LTQGRSLGGSAGEGGNGKKKIISREESPHMKEGLDRTCKRENKFKIKKKNSPPPERKGRGQEKGKKVRSQGNIPPLVSMELENNLKREGSKKQG